MEAVQKRNGSHKLKSEGFENISFLIFYIAAGITIRLLISLHSYSGENKPPMYGDYEAQRHWQEICVNLSPSQWYVNSTENDLLYWGLDYPPLTAYHSFLMGKVAQKINVSYVELYKSRGESTEEHKDFMRISVLVADLFVYIPAVIICCSAILREIGQDLYKNIVILYFILYPGQILIDNGHFQYNNISLGLNFFAVAAIFADKNILAAIFFSLALNYKQMELYHSLPIFIYLLRKCFPNIKKILSIDCLQKFILIASTVIVTFTIIWCPWLGSLDSLTSVVRRIFPVGRGIFEDKVANFWCCFNVFIKIKTLLTNESMAILSALTTLVSILPHSVHLFLYPNKINFLYALLNSSLSFFLFSFQVHEKSILLAALPALLIYPIEPFAAFWFLQISTFSMFPLFVKDNLVVAYIAMNGLFYFIHRYLQENSSKSQAVPNIFQIIYYVSVSLNTLLQFCHVFINPPHSLPHLFPLLISVLCFVNFALFFLYFNVRQISKTYNNIQVKKKYE